MPDSGVYLATTDYNPAGITRTRKVTGSSRPNLGVVAGGGGLGLRGGTDYSHPFAKFELLQQANL